MASEEYKRNRAILRGMPKITEKERDARRIEIECIEVPGSNSEDYIVTVCPKDKSNEPGHKHTEGPVSMTEPIKRVFKSEEETLRYLKEVL